MIRELQLSGFLRGLAEGGSRVCFRKKADAVKVFAQWNRPTIDAWGGLDQKGDRGEFDSVNERYEKRGRRKIVTIRQAISAVLPTRKPYCLDKIDLDTLNETTPAREAPFTLPDEAAVRRLERGGRVAPRRDQDAETGPGYPMTAVECMWRDGRGRKRRASCAMSPKSATPTGRVLYRPRMSDGSRPRIWIDQADASVYAEEDARRRRAELKKQRREARADFPFGSTASGRRSRSARLARRRRRRR